MSEMDAVMEGPLLRTHKNRVLALLRHFKDQGRTLEECTHRQRLGLKRKTLEKYCRDAGLSFSDYQPAEKSQRDRK